MSRKEESLDEKIARIRRQNEEIERRKKMIDEEIKDAERNNAIVKLKNRTAEVEEDEKFGPTLYSDQLSPDKKVVKSFEDDLWNVKPRQRKAVSRTNSTDEEWREERKRIDEERIRRQKANSGSWKREWDADKTASSNEHDNRISKDDEDRFNHSSSTAERSENRGGAYNFDESRRSFNHTNANEDEPVQSRWRTDSSFRKTYSERRTSNDYDNRKPVRSDSWRTNVSETDKYNNNATKPFSKSNWRSGIQSTSLTTKTDQFEEENWDTPKPYSKINSRSCIQNTPITTKNNQSEEKSLDIMKKPDSKNNPTSGIQSTSFTTKNDQSKVEIWDIKPVIITQHIKPKPGECWSGGNVKPRSIIQESERSSVAQKRTKPSFGFHNRFVQPTKPSNANNSWASKSPENKYKFAEENNLKMKDSETSSIIPKDFKNIVVQVGNFGISSDKREVKMFSDSKNDSNVPNASFNLNTSREVDSKTSPSYGSMTFERSDLKQKITPTYSENLSSPISIITQLFSNSKISDNDVNSKSSNSTRTVENYSQESSTDFQSPNVFQFSATQSKPDFGDIVHNTTTSQDVKIIRTIRNENIILVKEPPKKNGCDEFKKIKDTRVNKNDRKKTYEMERSEVIRKKELEEGDLSNDDDEEWDDCSDEEVEEEFV